MFSKSALGEGDVLILRNLTYTTYAGYCRHEVYPVCLAYNDGQMEG